MRGLSGTFSFRRKMDFSDSMTIVDRFPREKPATVSLLIIIRSSWVGARDSAMFSRRDTAIGADGLACAGRGRGGRRQRRVLRGICGVRHCRSASAVRERRAVRGVRRTGAGLKLSLKPDARPRKTERRRAERSIFQRVAAARASQL